MEHKSEETKTIVENVIEETLKSSELRPSVEKKEQPNEKAEKIKTLSESPNKKDAITEIQELIKGMTDDELKSMPADVMNTIRKKAHPYGNIPSEAQKTVITASITNLREKYMKRLLVTSMIGFLNRACDEWWVPKDVPVVPVYDYAKNPKLIDPPEDVKLSRETQASYDFNKDMMKKRMIVKEFLEDIFQYDPDLHVRSAYKPVPSDPQRTVLDTPAAKRAIMYRKLRDAGFRAEMDVSAKTPSKTVDSSVLELEGSDKNIVFRTVTEMIPPDDVFHNFTYYMEANYEPIRDAVKELYCEKADLEFAVLPCSVHPDVASADEYINKHKNEVITDMFKLHTGLWNILGPFKKSRESIQYYNENTSVAEEIFKQIESDAKMGKALMEQTMKKEKKIHESMIGKKNDPKFEAWRKQNSSLAKMGAVCGDDLKDECPENAVESDVFIVGDGGKRLEKKKLYFKADENVSASIVKPQPQ